MKEVNKFLLEDVLSPLIGGADMDEYSHLWYVDSDNELVIKDIIKEFFLPYFQTLNDAYHSKLKLSFAYYLKNNSKVDFERIIDSHLLPFAPPSPAINFFKWMWEVFFPGEDIFSISLDDVVERNDQYESLRLFNRSK